MKDFQFVEITLKEYLELHKFLWFCCYTTVQVSFMGDFEINLETADPLLLTMWSH